MDSSNNIPRPIGPFRLISSLIFIWFNFSICFLINANDPAKKRRGV